MGAHATAAQDAPVAVGNLAADLLAAHLATLRRFGESAPGFENRLLGSADGGLQRDRDVLVRKTFELAHDQRAACPLGQFGEVGDEQRETVSLVRLALG